MNKIRIILALGTWVSILPYLGFPFYIKNILFTLSGLAILFIGYLLYKEENMKKGSYETHTFDNFSQNGDFSKESENLE